MEVLKHHLAEKCRLLSRAILVTIAIALTIISPNQPAFSAGISEYKSQAIFLYNFVGHVTWPSGNNIKLCIAGDNEIRPYLESLHQKRNTYTVEIIRKYEDDYLEDCHLLFFNKIFNGNVYRMIERIKDTDILTVGNLQNFAKNGGIVQFYLKTGRVELRINTKRLNSTRLKIDRRLLSVSEKTGDND